MPTSGVFTAQNINNEEGCSTSPMNFGVDGEKKLLQHFSVDKNGAPLEQNAKCEILFYSRKQQ